MAIWRSAGTYLDFHASVGVGWLVIGGCAVRRWAVALLSHGDGDEGGQQDQLEKQ